MYRYRIESPIVLRLTGCRSSLGIYSRFNNFTEWSVILKCTTIKKMGIAKGIINNYLFICRSSCLMRPLYWRLK